jgi:hypothetical protein
MSEGLVTYTGQKAGLAVRNFASGSTELNVQNGHIPYQVFATGAPKTLPPQPAFLDIRTTKPASATQFLVALVPAKTAEEAKDLAGRMSEVSDAKWVGLQAVRGSERDLVMFRRGAANEKVQFREWSTDAASWTITQQGDVLKMLAAQNAHAFEQGGKTLFASDLPISLAIDFRTGAIELVASATAPTKLRLFMGAPLAGAQLDGRELAANSMHYSAKDGMITVELPAGQHRLSLVRR